MQDRQIQEKMDNEKSNTTIYVEHLAENNFKKNDGDIGNCRLTLGTEFETRINNEVKHVIIRITKIKI